MTRHKASSHQFRDVVTTFLLGLGSAVACAGDDEESEADAIQSSCEAICGALEECDPDELNEEGCVQVCVGDKSYSAEATKVVSECIDEASCAEIESGRWYRCVDDGYSDLKLSDAGTDFCEKVAVAMHACDDDFDENAIKDDCELQARSRRDDFIEANQKCIKRPCDDIEACAEEIAADFGTKTILDCCGPNNRCSWDNDGYCDCGGSYDWDAVDCDQ